MLFKISGATKPVTKASPVQKSKVIKKPASPVKRRDSSPLRPRSSKKAENEDMPLAKKAKNSPNTKAKTPVKKASVVAKRLADESVGNSSKKPVKKAVTTTTSRSSSPPTSKINKKATEGLKRPMNHLRMKKKY